MTGQLSLSLSCGCSQMVVRELTFSLLVYSHLLLQEAFLCRIVWAFLQPGCLMGPFESVGAWSSTQVVQ